MWKDAERFLSKDKYIGPLIRKYGSCAIVKRSKNTYFESLVRAIAGQQLSVKAAATIFGRVKDATGKVTPENILKLKKGDLRACGLSNAKSSYVTDLARHVKTGELEISRLDDLTDEKVMEELIAVKGIGPWTAEMFLMFSLARPDIFPVDDLGIANAMKKLIKSELTSDQMIKFAEKNWAPYRTVASWYLWELLDNK